MGFNMAPDILGALYTLATKGFEELNHLGDEARVRSLEAMGLVEWKSVPSSCPNAGIRVLHLQPTFEGIHYLKNLNHSVQGVRHYELREAMSN
jgi:hypothetical protein